MQFPVHIPFVEALGFELLRMDDGEAELALALQREHCNSFLVAHGGVSMTLLDVAMAHAARSINRDRPDFGPGVVTIEMKTTFMRPGEGQLRAVGRLLHHTATLAFCEGEILNGAGERIAHATGTFKYVRALAAGKRDVKPLQRRLDGAGSD
ncbi:PaaI family thioesterase [Eleftheria terrae]|uniref:PaaI family thioesterase n=1 Tax=Eleftheria terrae TaxID=1597781 RepID=UPI00263AEA59|nr:PaaI family thioesterase [Eleftheria terrae]WKB53275.1 PaaI family thioesterase [Eleftheria terrae]